MSVLKNKSLNNEELVSKEKSLKQLLWIGMGSICMLFAGWTSIIFVDKMQFPELPIWFMYSTIVIITSSVLLIIIKIRIKKDKPIFSMMSFVFILGLLFTYCQFKGWGQLVLKDIVFSGGPKELSLIYVLTGAHLVHLFAGLIALFITIKNTIRNRYNSINYLGLELTSIYWHFLALLWIYIFCFLNYL